MTGLCRVGKPAGRNLQSMSDLEIDIAIAGACGENYHKPIESEGMRCRCCEIKRLKDELEFLYREDELRTQQHNILVGHYTRLLAENQELRKRINMK